MHSDLAAAPMDGQQQQRRARRSLLSRISEAGGDLAGLAILALVALVGYDVLMRFLFNSPTIWASELSAYLLVSTVFLGAAYTSTVGGHIRLEVLSRSVTPAVKARLDVIAAWFALLFVAYLGWQAVVQVADSYIGDRRQFSLLLTPTYLPQISIAAGLLLFLAELIAQACRSEGSSTGKQRLVASVVLVTVAVLVLGQSAGWTILTLSVALALGLLAITLMISGFRVALTIAIVTVVLGYFLQLAGGGHPGWSLSLLGVLMIGLLTIGVPIAMSLGLVGLFGIYFLIPGFRPITLAERAWSVTNSFELTAVPAFLLMGELLLCSGLANELYQNMGRWIGRVRGGFAHASMAACTVFSAVSGSSVATAATIGVVAAPEMIQRGYSPRLAYGTLAAGGTLGILIPPSIVMLIYGSMMGVSIGDLFIAGIIPGLMLVGLFLIAIAIWAFLKPDAAPKGPRYSWADKLQGLIRMLPVLLILMLVLGGLYMGVFTPTESGVVGCLASMVLCLCVGKLKWPLLRRALQDTVRTTSFIMLVVVGAACMSYVLDYLRAPSMILASISALGWEPWLIMLVIFGGYIILGCLMDGISMMVITLPVVFPVVVGLGFDPVWLGIAMTLLIEVGLIHPPAGLNLFVLYGVAQRITPETTLTDIAVGVLPFLFQMLVMLGLLLMFPEIATWLPAQMRN